MGYITKLGVGVIENQRRDGSVLRLVEGDMLWPGWSPLAVFAPLVTVHHSAWFNSFLVCASPSQAVATGSEGKGTQ